MGSKVHSFLKQCCPRSSFYENKVLQLMSAEEGFVKVPCFHNMKFAQSLFKSETDFSNQSLNRGCSRIRKQ